MSGSSSCGEGHPEVDRVRDRYARRIGRVADRFGEIAERERIPILLELVDRLGMPRDQVHLLEIGCGAGRNLERLLEAGFRPERLVGNELLPERVTAARVRLPHELVLLPGDASMLDLPEQSFDVVFQSTVFTSILDGPFRSRLAEAMWRLVRPGGAVLWYDFMFDNPSNPDVRGVPIREIRRLFPRARAEFRRVTLAPPLARAVLRLPSWLGEASYRVLSACPGLRTHVFGWLAKPAD